MAAVAGTGRAGPSGGERTHRGRSARAPGTRWGFSAWRWVVLLVAAAYFAIPLYAALRFAGWGSFRSVVHQAGFTSALGLSIRLAVITTVITLALMLPTAVYVHLRLPRLRRLLEGITILPIVIPPVVLIVGVLQIAPGALKGTPYLLALVYVVLAMPFAYRSIDAGLRAFDLKTLVEASNSLGAGWPSTLWRVVLPNLTTALLSATVLTVALVLGEYTMASLDLYQTFPVWIVVFDQTSGPISVAASLLALFVTWIFLLAITMLGRRQARRTGGGQVALFPSSGETLEGTHDREHRQTRRPATGTGQPAPAPAPAGRTSRCRASAGPTDPSARSTGCRSRSPRASWWRCSAPRAAGRPPPCASWPDSSRRIADR